MSKKKIFAKDGGKTFILDSSALINPRSLPINKRRLLTTHSVIDEIKDPMTRLRSEILLQSGILIIQIPPKQSLTKVKGIARQIGTINTLSETDLEIAALADSIRKENAIVITDDKELQNLLSFLEIRYIGASFETIKRRIIWKKVCKICNLEAQLETRHCERCGSLLKKKAVEVEKI